MDPTRNINLIERRILPQRKLWVPTRIPPWKPPYIESFFRISRSFQNVVNAEDIQLRFCSANTEVKKSFRFIFYYFWLKYWSQGDLILPSFLYQYCLQILLMTFFSNSKKLFWVLYVHYFEIIFQRRWDGIVGRVVDTKTEISGSNPTVAILVFFFWNLPHLRKAEDFFWPKNLRFFPKSTT